VPFIPGGAFYLFCDISFSGMDSISFARKLLEEKKVAVIPGTPFGHDDFIRISFAADMDTLKEGVKRIGQWLKV
jgi:aspartate aminotransferase